MYASLLLCLFVSSWALPPIVLKGNQLYNSETKERFYVKGVAYAPALYANKSAGGFAIDSDPFEDHFTDDKEPLWSKDLPLLKDLGINSLRLYNVNPTANHDKFMHAAEAAGLYVVVSTTVPVGAGVLDASKPASMVRGEGCYTTGLVYSAKQIVSAFAKYNNTLAFMVANEIGQYALNGTLLPGYHAIPCVKALVRDLRAYMKACSCGMRYIPMMYAATDLQPKHGVNPRDLISQYLTCGNDAVDLYGVNIYTWCAYASTFSKLSTYKNVTDAYATYDTAMLFSEFGCTYGQFENYYPFLDDTSKPTSQRQWKQIDTLFSKNMSDVFSGGFAYQYSMSEIIYGMVLLPGYTTNTEIRLLPNYNYAKQHFTAVSPEAQTATWTDANLCSWKPPIFATKVKSTCPSSALAQQLFDTETENWSKGIPPYPGEEADFACPHYPITSFDKKENLCREPGGCACDLLTPNPHCSVEWDHLNLTDPAVAANISQLLSVQCGLLHQFGGSYSAACESFAGGGQYFGCRAEEKANFALEVWFQNVKHGEECCANIFTEGGEACKAVAMTPTPAAPTRVNPYCGEIQVEAGCSVNWAGQNLSDPAVAANVKHLMDTQCGLLSEFGVEAGVQDTCDLLKPLQRYDGCSLEQQANLVLGTWFMEVKQGTECCARLFTPGGRCGAPLTPGPSAPPPAPTSPTAPTSPVPPTPAPTKAPTNITDGSTPGEKQQNSFPVVIVAAVGGGLLLLLAGGAIYAFWRSRTHKEQNEQYGQLN